MSDGWTRLDKIIDEIRSLWDEAEHVSDQIAAETGETPPPLEELLLARGEQEDADASEAEHRRTQKGVADRAPWRRK